MIILTINPSRLEDQIIKTKLDEMFLAKEVIEDESISQAKISHGGRLYQGEEISNYFDELQKLYDSWYEDRCDKYENVDGSQKF